LTAVVYLIQGPEKVSPAQAVAGFTGMIRGPGQGSVDSSSSAPKTENLGKRNPHANTSLQDHMVVRWVLLNE